jgi:hypothetical protein
MWRDLIEFYQKKGLIYEGPLSSLRGVSVLGKKKNLFDFRALCEALDE